MPDTPAEPVAHGDRRDEVWIEADARQKTKVRHTWPTEPPPEEVSQTPLADRPGGADVTDSATLPQAPSAWEARED